MTDTTADVSAAITRTHREEWARIVAGLTRRFGDLDLAEDMAAEAFAAATGRWATDGIPPNTGAWITMTARRKAIDHLRREASRTAKHREASMLEVPSEPVPVGVVDDDRLRLLFTCCHPALTLEARVALTLRVVGGLTVTEIAHAFLVKEATIGQRISRAKAKIKTAGIPYRIPDEDDLPPRIDGVLTVLYLIFNEGYLASGEGSTPLRPELTGEAIRLARLTHELLPRDTEVAGLLAMMLLTEARAAARLSSTGALVRLDEQDRGTWDPALIAEGRTVIRDAFALLARADAAPGRYLLTAAINEVHVSAAHAGDTDWARIVSLYEQLERIDASPVVALNKAIAVSELTAPDAGLELVDRLAGVLADHHAFHVTRAELLRSAGRDADALAAYDRAILLAGNTAEIAHLTRRRESLAAASEDPATGSTEQGEPR